MKLHPVTQLILFAVLLLLMCSAIAFAAAVRQLANIPDAMPREAFLLDAWARLFKSLARALAFAGSAIWVEALYRWWRLLRDRRVRRETTRMEAAV